MSNPSEARLKLTGDAVAITLQFTKVLPKSKNKKRKKKETMTALQQLIFYVICEQMRMLFGKQDFFFKLSNGLNSTVKVLKV